jgi:aryl-alcohol dehydrogenase-like predicted oxidoreductase
MNFMSNDGMATRVHLGAGGPEVGVQGLGCMGMSWAYGPADETQSRAALERALELGVTLFDTADVYGLGANEEFIAPFVQANRDRLVVATKFAIVRRDDDPYSTPLFRNDPPYIRQAIEGSLRRLGIDHVDLYYMHRRNPDVPIEESVGAMAELVAAGTVRHLGLSEVSGSELRAAHAVHPIAAVQSEWSLFSRDVEESVVPAAREHGIGLVPYSPLGRGMLTDASVRDLASDDFRRRLPRFAEGALDANLALVEQVRGIARSRGATPAQVALAWLLAQGEDVVPIPGTKRRTYLEENLGAVDVTLEDADVAALSALVPIGERTGDMTWVNRDTAARV